jgi:hypothetical protein
MPYVRLPGGGGGGGGGGSLVSGLGVAYANIKISKVAVRARVTDKSG